MGSTRVSSTRAPTSGWVGGVKGAVVNVSQRTSMLDSAGIPSTNNTYCGGGLSSPRFQWEWGPVTR